MEPFRILQHVAPATMHELQRRGSDRTLAAGETLYARSAPATEVFLIRSGRVKLWRSLENGTVLALAFLVAGDVAGLLSMSRQRPFSITATAVTPIEVTGWRSSLVIDLMAQDPKLATNVHTALTRRIDMMVERMEELMPVSVERRIARVLVRLGREIGVEATGGGIGLPLSRADIAELARTTVPTVSRIMGRWRADGVVDGPRGAVTVLRADVLTQIGRDPG